MKTEGARIAHAIADVGDAEAVAEAFSVARQGARAGRHSRQQCRLLRASDLRPDRSQPAGSMTSTAISTAPITAPMPCLPGMTEKGAGSIIAIGSVNGLGALGDPAYSAAKAGMISLTRSLALEYGRFGIRVQYRAARHGAHAAVGAHAPPRIRACWNTLQTLVSARPHRRAHRCGARRRLPRIRRGRRHHGRGASGRLRSDRPAISSWRAN